MVHIETTRCKDGIFFGSTSHVPTGQAACAALLHQCYRQLHHMYDTATEEEVTAAAEEGVTICEVSVTYTMPSPSCPPPMPSPSRSCAFIKLNRCAGSYSTVAALGGCKSVVCMSGGG